MNTRKIGAQPSRFTRKKNPPLGLVAKTELLEEGVVVYYNGQLAEVTHVYESDVSDLKKEEAELKLEIEVQQPKVDYLNSGEEGDVNVEAKKDLDGMSQEVRANFIESLGLKRAKLTKLQSDIEAGENDLTMTLRSVAGNAEFADVVPADVEIVSIRREPPPDQFKTGDTVTPILASHPMFRRVGRVQGEEKRVIVMFNHLSVTFNTPELLSFLSRESNEGEVERIMKDFKDGDITNYDKHEKYMKQMIEESYGVDTDEMPATEVVETFASLSSQPKEFFDIMNAVNSDNRQNMAKVLSSRGESTVGLKDDLRNRLLALLPSPMSGDCVSEIKHMFSNYGIDNSGSDVAIVARLKMILNKYTGKTGNADLANLFVQPYVKNDDTLQSVINFLSSEKLLPAYKSTTETAFSSDATVSSLQKILKTNKLNYTGTDSDVKSRVVSMLRLFTENQRTVSSTASTVLNTPESDESPDSLTSPESKTSDSNDSLTSPESKTSDSNDSLTSPESKTSDSNNSLTSPESNETDDTLPYSDESDGSESDDSEETDDSDDSDQTDKTLPYSESTP
jgi:hypothetical protein